MDAQTHTVLYSTVVHDMYYISVPHITVPYSAILSIGPLPNTVRFRPMLLHVRTEAASPGANARR